MSKSKAKDVRTRVTEQIAHKYTRSIQEYLEAERRLNTLMRCKPTHFTTVDPDTGQSARVAMSEEHWRRDIRILAMRVRKAMNKAGKAYSCLRVIMGVGRRPHGWGEFVKPPARENKPGPYGHGLGLTNQLETLKPEEEADYDPSVTEDEG